MKPKYVYVASSWKNDIQPHVCAALAKAHIDHYDFKNPGSNHGFSWNEVDPDYDANSTEVWTYLRMLQHSRAIEGFKLDFEAMQKADTFVLVLPCGKSAHLELGWAVGAGKRTAILLENPIQPELMYKMVDYFAFSIYDLMEWLDGNS